MEESNVATRLKHFIEYKGVSITQFADQCGIPRPTLSQLLSGRNKKLSDVIVKLIHDRFPDLSVLWLMFGEGEMILPTPINPSLASEAEKFMDGLSEIDEDENLSGLTYANFASNSSENKQVSSLHLHNETAPQIGKSEPKPRKVKSITVFYDDNSYETFLPEKK